MGHNGGYSKVCWEGTIHTRESREALGEVGITSIGHWAKLKGGPLSPRLPCTRTVPKVRQLLTNT